jgi:uncharacterized Tic20 family protein
MKRPQKVLHVVDSMTIHLPFSTKEFTFIIKKSIPMNTQEYMGHESLPQTQPSSDERTMAILSHVLCIIGSFIAPLIIYLLKKDESPYVKEHALEALNFQITMIILYIISGILILILVGFLLIWALSLINLILIIVATIKASEDKLYKYPFNFRLIK